MRGIQPGQHPGVHHAAEARAVPDEIAESVVGAIAKSVNTGTIGDGKLWVVPVDSVLRVRTGERGRDAV